MSFLLPIFVASIRSVGTACTMAGVGMYLHRRNFIVGEGKRTLALISQQVTIPAFLFTKIVYCNQDWSDEPCPDIADNMGDVWVLLFWPAYVVGCGILVGWVAAKIARTPTEQFRSVLAACAFGNSTGLPITLLSVIHANFSPQHSLGHVDPTLFLSVYLLLYPVLQWALGGWLLAPSESDVTDIMSKDVEDEDGEQRQDGTKEDGTDYCVPQDIAVPKGHIRQHMPTLRSLQTFSSPPHVLNNKSAQNFYKTKRKGIFETDASLYISNADLVGMAASYSQGQELAHASECHPPLAPPPPPSQLDSDSSPTTPSHTGQEHLAVIGEQTPLLHSSAATAPSSIMSPSLAEDDSSSVGSITVVTTKIDKSSFLHTLSEIASRCLQPPVVGAVLGLIVAATPLRGIFVDLVNRADAAPLEWAFDGLYSVGQAAVPINMMILGCNLSASTLAKSGSASLLSDRTMAAIVIGKMLVMPCLGIVSAVLLDLVWDMPEEIAAPFYLVAMIVFITPTANNVMVMVELSGSGTKEGIARVIGWQYAVAPILLSLSVTAVVGVAIQWT